jgi:hypothetical protein
MSGGGLQQSPVATNLPSTVTTTEKFRVVSTLSHEEIKRLQHFVTSGESVGGQYNYSRLLDPAAQRMLKVFCSTRAEDDRDWATWESSKLFALLYKHFPAPSQASAAGADARNFAKSMVLDLGHSTTACLKRGELFAVAREKTQAEDLTPDVETELVQAAMKRQIATAVGPTRRYKETILADALKATSWEEAEEAIFKATTYYSEALAMLKNDYGMEVATARAPTGDSTKPTGDAKGDGHTKGKQPPENKTVQASGNKPTCNACGRDGHRAGKNSCLFVHGKHPDLNPEWKTSWADSAKGKACKAAGHDSLPARKTLAGTVFDFADAFAKFKAATEKKGNSPSLHICCNTQPHAALKGHTLGCGVHGAHPSNNKIFETLIDTGALQANYMSTDLAAWLTSHGVPVQTDINTCRVCGLYGCSNTKEYANFNISMVDKNTQLIFNINIKAWLINDSPYDLILGRPTIEEHSLIDRISLAGNALALVWEEQKSVALSATLQNDREQHPQKSIYNTHAGGGKNPRKKPRKNSIRHAAPECAQCMEHVTGNCTGCKSQNLNNNTYDTQITDVGVVLDVATHPQQHEPPRADEPTTHAKKTSAYRQTEKGS